MSAAKAEGYAEREKMEIAVSCSIYSDEELERICEFFNCQFYELDFLMVEKYYEEHSEELQAIIEKNNKMSDN